MSNKNLLNEATIRRFMKLANMEPLTNPFVDRLDEAHCGDRDDDMDPMEEEKRQGYDDREDEAESARLGKIADKDVSKAGRRADVRGKWGDRHGGPVTEDAHEEDELHATEDELGDEDAEADRERDEIDDLEADDDAGGALTADEVKDVLMNALQDFAASVSDDLDIDMDVSDDDAPEMEVAAVAVGDDGDEVEMDAEEAMLESIQVVDDTELINEVAKRVTARLVKAMATKK
jgi:hypothetical protein